MGINKLVEFADPHKKDIIHRMRYIERGYIMKNTEKIWNIRFILLFITNLLMMATFYAAVPVIPVYCQEVGITSSQVGVILTAMSVTTVLFRPFAGYILDNFNRYRVYLLFLALFSLPFLGFAFAAAFSLLVLIRLYMGIVYSVCGSATMTLAGDVLPQSKVGPGINRFALTNSLGMAAGPFIGIQVQAHLGARASFISLFVLTIIALICVSFCRIDYPKKERKSFKLSDTIYKPALPFLLNMMFIMIPFGAVIAYSSILAQEIGISEVTPYFYICLVAGNTYFKAVYTASHRRGKAQDICSNKSASAAYNNGKLLLYDYSCTFPARRIHVRSGIRNITAAFSVVCYGNYSGAETRRGKRDLSAFI